MAAGTTAQSSGAQEAGRPQPQTTVEASGGPFIRHSQAGRAPIYDVANQTFGGMTTQPLVARPGYYRNFRITHTVTGGTSGEDSRADSTTVRIRITSEAMVPSFRMS